MRGKASARGGRERQPCPFPPPRHWSHTRTPNRLAPRNVHMGGGHSPPEGSAIEMKATRRYAAGLAAIVVTGAGLLAGTAAGASASTSGGGFGAFVGPLHHTSVIASTVPG